MVEAQNIFWEKFQKHAKIFKIKAFRAWHRFDKQYGISRHARKATLALGLKLVLLAAPHAQISLHAQNVQKTSSPLLLAKAKAAEASDALEYADFIEKHKEMIIERQKTFAKALWETLQSNITTVQQAEKKGQRTKTLRGLFNRYKKVGISIDPQYYCCSAGLGSFMQTVDDGDFEEYRLLFECLTSPNSCRSIIDDFKSSFGDKKESQDIQATLADIFHKNPYTVCIVFSRSPRSRSGYHYVTVFPNSIAVDTVLNAKDSLCGKTARFNRTIISDTEDYFKNSYNKGYVFDVTEMIGDYQTFQMFMEYLEEKNNQIMKRFREITPPKPSLTIEPLSSIPSPQDVPADDFSWKAVSRKPFEHEQSSFRFKRGERLI